MLRFCFAEVGAIDLNRLGGSVNRPYQRVPRVFGRADATAIMDHFVCQ